TSLFVAPRRDCHVLEPKVLHRTEQPLQPPAVRRVGLDDGPATATPDPYGPGNLPREEGLGGPHERETLPCDRLTGGDTGRKACRRRADAHPKIRRKRLDIHLPHTALRKRAPDTELAERPHPGPCCRPVIGLGPVDHRPAPPPPCLSDNRFHPPPLADIAPVRPVLPDSGDPEHIKRYYDVRNAQTVSEFPRRREFSRGGEPCIDADCD